MVASVNDFGGADPDRLDSPPLGGPDGWAAAVAAALDGSDVTVDERLTAHRGEEDPHPVYETSAEVDARIAAHSSAADPHPVYETSVEAAAKITAHEAALDPHSGYLTPTEHAATDHTGIPGVGGGSSLPDQTGQGGKYLTTDGTDPSWGSVAGGGGGAVGGGTDQVFYENDTNVTTSYTITTGKNAVTAGPVTVDSGATVTVPSGSSWVVV